MDLIDREQALKALEEISYALWEIDIPSPTVPEYVEHHEGVQSVMEVVDRWARKIQALPSARPKGKWMRITQGADPEKYMCPFCHRTVEDYGSECFVSIRYPYCHCGADMREVEE